MSQASLSPSRSVRRPPDQRAAASQVTRGLFRSARLSVGLPPGIVAPSVEVPILAFALAIEPLVDAVAPLSRSLGAIAVRVAGDLVGSVGLVGSGGIVGVVCEGARAGKCDQREGDEGCQVSLTIQSGDSSHGVFLFERLGDIARGRRASI